MADEPNQNPTDTTNSETVVTTTGAEATTTTTEATTNDATVLGTAGTEAKAEPTAEETAAAEAETARREALTDDERKAEDDAAAAAVAGPPEKYELALKDGEGKDVALSAEAVALAEPVFKELGLSNDQANKLMPVAQAFAEQRDNAMIAKIVEMGANQKKEWFDAFKADPELGGAKLDESTHLAGKGLDAVGFTKDHPFRVALDETGFGNHPDMIRTFRLLGEMVSEDGTFARTGETSRKNPAGWESRYQSETTE